MTLKYNIKDMEDLAHSRNFTFLSNGYTGIMKKHKWQCDKGHQWESRPNDIKSGCGCPYCAGKRKDIHTLKKLIENRPLKILSDKYLGMHSKHKWECDKCNYIWKSTVGSVVNSKTGCPKCAGWYSTLEDIQHIAKNRGFTLLSQRFMGMAKKHEWQCPDGHKWSTTITHIKQGTGCPCCNNKYVQEEKCRFILEQLTQKEFRKDRSTLGNRLELDGYCEELNIAFEYHGKQHFRRIPYWHKNGGDLPKQQKRDSKKLKRCKELDIDLIVIRWDCNNLEDFLRTKLKRRGLFFTGRIDWKKFRDNPSRLQEVQEAAKRINVECLSKKYIAAREPMKFKCKKCSRQWTSTSNDIKNGYGCLKCGGTMRGNISEIRKRGRALGLDLISPKYVNAKTKVEWQCDQCSHNFMKAPSDIQQGKGCPECGIKKRWEMRRSRHLLTIP